MDIAYNTFCERGSVRQTNQDRVTAYAGSDFSFFAVADGMGGHSEGEYASETVIRHVERLADKLVNAHGDIQKAADIVISAIAAANDELFRYSAEKGIICGSTVAVLVFVGSEFAVINAGDSPVYYSDRHRAVHASAEHRMGEMRIKSGLADKMCDDIRAGRLTQAVGAAEKIFPYVRTGKLSGRQAFLLCSDGVSRYNSDRDICRLLRAASAGRISAENAAEYLRERVYSAGAEDNLTACIIVTENTDSGALADDILKAVYIAMAVTAAAAAGVMIYILK